LRHDLVSRPRGRSWTNGPAATIAEPWSAGATRERDKIVFRIELPTQTVTFELTPEGAARLGRELTEAAGFPVIELDPEEES
jgi:hypothetical protein